MAKRTVALFAFVLGVVATLGVDNAIRDTDALQHSNSLPDPEAVEPQELVYSDQTWQVARSGGDSYENVWLSGPEQFSIVVHEQETSRIVIINSDKPYYEQGLRLIDFGKDGMFEFVTINGREYDPNP